MKNLGLLLIVVVGFFSCSNNVEFNNPAMQAKKDGEIWKGISFRANVDENGRLTITGSSNDSDNLTLKVSSTVLSTSELGNTVSEATYNDGVGTLYSTNNSPDPEVSLYEPDGQIEIYEYDGQNKYVSGRFNFNAFDISGTKTINFNQGDFYRVPVTGESIDNACDVATQLVTSTQTVFNATDASDPDYSSACNSYRNALVNKINACGDDDGSLQTIIDSLGDCTSGNSDPCDIATANANAAEADYNAVPNTDPQYPTVCNDYKTALMNKIDQCGDADGTIQMIIDDLGDCSVVTPTDPTGVISLDLGTASLTFESDIMVTQMGTILKVSARDGDANGNLISFEVTQNATGIDIISNFMIEVGAARTVYIPTTNPMEVFTSNITVNNGTVVNGTFSGVIEPTSGSAPDFTLNNGVIDIMY